jgi:Domain of unknown function (DUF4390)
MRRVLAVLALALVLPAADAAEIADLKVSLDGDRVLLSFQLDGAFTPQLVERVESGLPTTLLYELELLRDRKRWFDRGLDEASLTVVGIYDAVRREYLVNYKLDGRLLESRMVHDLAGLERAMTRVERLHVFTLEPTASKKRLLVRARAELGTRHILGFIPSKIATDWQESPKFHPLAPLVEE